MDQGIFKPQQFLKCRPKSHFLLIRIIFCSGNVIILVKIKIIITIIENERRLFYLLVVFLALANEDIMADIS